MTERIMTKIRLKENVMPLVGGAILVSPLIWLILVLGTLGWLFTCGWWGYFATLALCIIIAICIGFGTQANTEMKQNIYTEIETEKKENAHRFDEKYGACTKSVILEGNGFYYIRVYEEAQVLVAWTGYSEGVHKYVECRFDDIVSCEYNGEQITPQTSIRANNSGIIGRAAVGTIVAGPVGAIIGGITTPNKVETTIHSTGNDVLIYTNIISDPLIRIPFGFRANEAREVFATIKAIIYKYLQESNRPKEKGHKPS